MRTDMPDVYAMSDVVVLTSDNEGTPVSLIEAQAAARPTVATDVGGVPTVVVHESTGFVVRVDDDRAFAVAIERLADDGELRAAMGARGREHVVDRFGIDRLVGDIDALYQDLLGARAGPGAR
jgi:glycosyltransferase involved in cell wall biosynthesis